MFPNPALEGKNGTHQVPVFERMSAVLARTIIFNLSAGLTVCCSETRSAIMPGQVLVVCTLFAASTALICLSVKESSKHNFSFNLSQ